MATDRFKDAVWLPIVKQHYTVVGGAGGIGSCLALLLARLEPESITIYDPDTVDTVNMSNQLFSIDDNGKSKVSAIKGIINDYSLYQVSTKQEFFTEDSPRYDIYFSCFDNMKARKAMYEVFKKSVDTFSQHGIVPLLIDGRLTAEQFQIYVVTPDRLERYEKTLFDDSEAAVLACGFKGTTHNSFMIASKMIACYTNFCANIATEEPDRVLPFMIDNDIFTMTETIEL